MKAVIRNEEDLHRFVSSAASSKLERDKLAVIKAEKIKEISEEYDALIEERESEYSEKVEAIALYAQSHRKELFHGKQSVRVLGHELEFRKSPGKVFQLTGFKVKQSVNLALALEDEELSEKLTDVNATLDKNAIQKHWEGGEDNKALIRSLGVEVRKEESFSFTPNQPDEIEKSVKASQDNE